MARRVPATGSLHFNPLRIRGCSFLSNVPQFPKEHSFSLDFQTSPVCPTGKTKRKRRRAFSTGAMTRCHVVHQKSQMDWPGIEHRHLQRDAQERAGPFKGWVKGKNKLMLYREINAVCSEIHTKHINTLCGQNVGLYIKTQSVPRSKHTPSRLYKPVS